MFYRCSQCNELRTPNYPYCPGCISSGRGRRNSVSRGPVQTLPSISQRMLRGKPPRTFKMYNLFASAFVCAIFWTGNNSTYVNHQLSIAYAGPSLNQDMLRLCELDESAETSHSYPKNMVYLKAWIGEIAGGTVHMQSLAPENHLLSVTVPSKVTLHQAKSRAKFYRIIYADLRKQYLPQDKANSCAVIIYNESGKKLASA